LNNPVLLIFTDWFVPGYKAGGPVRSVVNLIDAIEDQMEVCIVTSDRDFEDTSAYPYITANEWRPYSRHSRVFYASPGFLTFKNIRRLIQNVQPDTVYLNSMWSFRFTLMPLWLLKNKPSIKVVMAPRGMLKPSALKIKPLKKRLALSVMKWSIIPKRTIFHSTDAKETADIQKVFPHDVVTLGNLPSTIMEPVALIKKTGHLSLVFMSRIHPIKNLLFLLQLLKDVPQTITLTLHIVGPEEDKKYLELCRQTIAQLPTSVLVYFNGPVEHNQVATLLQNHHFFILPTKGENFGHAIFESFAAGRPVIISDQTPWKDLASKKIGYDLPLNNPEAWVQTIQKCADMNQSEFDTWCFHAYHWAKNYSDNNQLKEKYIQLFS